MSERVGFYICHCGINIAARVRCGEVARHAAAIPGVAVSRDYLFMCSDPGQELIERDVAALGLTRVVVAACSPRMHESTFRAAVARAGLNPYAAFHQVCVREHGSWVHGDGDEATAKALLLCRAGIARVLEQQQLQPQRFPVHTSALVVGGGIAGMQAALDIAAAGHQVYLVEQQPTIGGHMLQYDKTFPTLDCAACIGTPKMVAVGQSKRIELLTHAEVEQVSGFVGNFRVRVRKRSRYVDACRCTGCGDCAQVCPVARPNEWDVATRLRRAIYRPFPQAVPISFLIDKRDRAPCVQGCPAGTNVQGYVALVGQGRWREAVQLIMERLPFPGTLGRVCPAPCESHCRRQELDEPLAIRGLKRFAADQVDLDELPLPAITPQGAEQRVAVIGAGPAGLSAAYFLARRGYPVTVFEALPVAGGLLRTGIPAYRLPPEVLEREIRFIRRLGVEIRTSTPIGAQLTVDELFRQGFRAVFASTGTQQEARLGLAGEEAEGVVSGVAFLRQVALQGSARVGGEVLVIGGGAVATDAARTALRLGAGRVRIFYRRRREQMPAWAAEVRATLAEGVEIHDCWAPQQLVVAGGKVAGMTFARTRQVADASGRVRLLLDEGERCTVPADMVLVAIGQQPDTSWAAGSSRLPLDEQGFLRADPVTYATARPGLFAGGELHTGPSIVVQAVADGQQAAESIDRYLRGEDLRLGRPARPAGDRFAELPELAAPASRVHQPELPVPARQGFAEVELGLREEQARAEAARCIACGGCAECMLCVGQCQAGAIDHGMQDELVELDVGALVVATGFAAMDPRPMPEYGYGRLPNVFTNLELERLLNATGPTAGKVLLRDPHDRLRFIEPPSSVAILHCIGSRDRSWHAYCSRTCCMYALKYAHLLKDRLGHRVQVYNLYIDMRCFGKGYEEFYQRVQEEGVRMIRGKAAEITDIAESEEEQGKLVVVVEDTLAGRLLRLPVDMAVLCTAMEPSRDAARLARTFGLTLGNDGFFLEEHPKLEPVSTPTAGVFVAGACQGPKDIPDAVAQAKAAASMAQALLTLGEVEASPILSAIDPEICSGCQSCLGQCPYSAIEFDARRGLSVVNGAVCKGCGSCAAFCPSGAAKVKHFTDRQIFAEIEGLLGGERMG